MTLDRDQRMAEITREIRLGEYRVDPRMVADAIVSRLGIVAALKDDPRCVRATLPMAPAAPPLQALKTGAHSR